MKKIETMEEAIKAMEEARQEAERYKLTLYIVVHNYISPGCSVPQAATMALDTMDQVICSIDIPHAKRAFDMAKQMRSGMRIEA